MKSDDRPDELHEAFERLIQAMYDLWPPLGAQIEQESPPLIEALNQFVDVGGHFRLVFSFAPETRLTLEAVASDGETRAVYALRGRVRVRPAEPTRDEQKFTTH